jgi:hypothetical protein
LLGEYRVLGPSGYNVDQYPDRDKKGFLLDDGLGLEEALFRARRRARVIHDFPIQPPILKTHLISAGDPLEGYSAPALLGLEAIAVLLTETHAGLGRHETLDRPVRCIFRNFYQVIVHRQIASEGKIVALISLNVEKINEFKIVNRRRSLALEYERQFLGYGFNYSAPVLARPGRGAFTNWGDRLFAKRGRSWKGYTQLGWRLVLNFLGFVHYGGPAK